MWLWEQVLSKVAERIPAQHFEIWFRPTALQGVDERRKEFHVLVPNQHFRYWLKEKYQRVLAEVLQEVRLGDWSVCFAAEEDAAAELEAVSGVATSSASDEVESVQGLNTRYSFESFVVGSSNQFAHAAAEAVANQPACSYNPLFIYGGVGLGKTHLMHAMGHRIRTRSPHLRLAYISSESFVNELIHAIRFDYDRMVQFREKYRSIDVLLMDDIQFLAGKERTQEEFFHTFNALYDAQKQIVVSSDAPPRSIPTLEERLHSRFEWGLIADIQPPDLETKIAILRRKADAKGVGLDDEVILFIAANIKSNIRELEGALVRLVAYSSLTGDAINLGLAQRVLHNLVEQQTRVITIGQIQRSVAEHYQLRISELKAKDNSRRVAEPRQIAMYLSKELTQNSLSEIGREFGGKHHTTVIHAIRKVERQQQDDPKLKATLNRLMESIQ